MMTKSKHATKAYVSPIDIILLLLAIAGLIILFPNWETHSTCEVSFPINCSQKVTSYYNVKCESLRLAQSEGNPSCAYTVYCQSRTQSRYEMVVHTASFNENCSSNGEIYSLPSHWWNDIRFKVKKTDGLNTASSIQLILGSPK